MGVRGRGGEAIRCLRRAHISSPPDAAKRGVALVSLANVLVLAGFAEDATVAMQMALKISPNTVLNHFTMANVMNVRAKHVEAAFFYETTLRFQPNFGPALSRLKFSRCSMKAMGLE